MTPTIPTPTMPMINTLTAVREIHRSTNNLATLPLPAETAKELQARIDAVLSFTAYYLRVEKANCRPSQADALAALINLNDELEKQHGNTNMAA